MRRHMKAFLQRIWVFVRPYRQRLFLGLLCGCVYALSSGAIMLLVQMVVDAVFPGTERFSLMKQVEKWPEFIQPLARSILQRLPDIQSPNSTSGARLLICALPVVMLLRGLCGYLNVY